MLSTLLSASVFALAANSFLIPIDIIQDVRVSELAPLAPQSQTIRLDCSSCPFALSSERNGRHEWTNDVKSDLEMEFSVDGSSISLNGKPFYPINFPHIPPALSVKQIQKTNDGDTSAKKWEGYHKALTMSYSLEIDEKHFPENGADAIKIVMTIMGLEGQMIQVDAVEIKVLKQANGKQNIVSVVAVPDSANPADAKCSTIFCRILNKLNTKVHKVKESAKSATESASGKAKAFSHKIKSCCIRCMQFFRGTLHHNHHHNLHHNLKNGGKKLGTFVQPYHHEVDKSHVHMSHRHHSWLHNFFAGTKHVLSIVLFPILVGIAFGVTASAVGMLVGQLVVFLWVKYRRTDGEATYERVETDEKDELPAYEESEGLEVQVAEKEDVEKA